MGTAEKPVMLTRESKVEINFAGPEESRAARWLWRDWIAAIALFLATAAVVLWQNSRLGVLWDLSYILENSYRVSLGDMPYRDFPLAHAPGTFLIQAALIKLTGRAVFHHLLYCAVIGGLSTVLAWRILCNLLRSDPKAAWGLALMLSTPLTVLGIYCIFPHPFYDPDCTFAILVGILLLLNLERGGFGPCRAFISGLVLVIPLFVKQNTGLAFVGSTALVLIALVAREAWHRRRVAGYLWLLAGMAAGLVSALLLIHVRVGLGSYAYWTLHYAGSRRLPRLSDMLSVYQEHTQAWWWLAAFIAGLLLLRWAPRGRRFLVVSISALILPFVWVLVAQFIKDDPSDRAELLLALWPFVLIVAAISSVLRLRGPGGIVTLALPFIVIGSIHGAFLSQQLWGSTYAIWPLLIILLGSSYVAIGESLKERSVEMRAVVFVATMSLIVAGGFYVYDHERLNYADLSGEVARSKLPALTGLSIPGPWIPQFEQLVGYAEQEIPQSDGLLMIPGEDLFYYATGRHPRFPVLVFDYTVNPYTPDEILDLSRSRNIRWLIVKRKVQLNRDPVEDRERLLALLMQDFHPVKSLDNYDVYQRNAPPHS